MLLTVLTGLWSWQSACNFGDARVFIVFIKATILKPFIFLRHNAGPKRRSQSKCAAVLTVFVNRATEHKNAVTQHVFVTFVKWIKLIYVIPRVWQRALPRLYRVIHNSMAHFTKNRYTSRGERIVTGELGMEREILQVSSACKCYMTQLYETRQTSSIW